MKPRVNVSIRFQDQEEAESVLSGALSRLSGKQVHEQHASDLAPPIEGDGVDFYFDVRFNNQADRDSIANWIQTQIENNPQVEVIKARVGVHECSHDEANPAPCTETVIYEYP